MGRTVLPICFCPPPRARKPCSIEHSFHLRPECPPRAWAQRAFVLHMQHGRQVPPRARGRSTRASPSVLTRASGVAEAGGSAIPVQGYHPAGAAALLRQYQFRAMIVARAVVPPE